MAISAVEVAVGLAWTIAVAVVVWSLWAHRVTGAEAALLLVIVTLLPVVGPLVSVLFVLGRRHQADRRVGPPISR